ncbi:porin [Burkholderia anthina]|uniref:porin n=1 Tax=Burkholderia anthina TaxID=179879 RepID=UPI0027294EF2
MYRSKYLLVCLTFVVGMGACDVAKSQSSVTLYGALDAGVFFANKTLSSNGGNGGKVISLVDSAWGPSVFGLTGNEDLGGGLHAIFRLEGGLSVANGGAGASGGIPFGRNAYVGLSGDYGVVKIGLQYSPLFVALIETDARNLEFFGSGSVIFGEHLLAGMFTPNAISYTTPNLGGIQATALVSLGGIPGDFQAGRQYSLSARYESGPFLANAVIYSGNAGGSATTSAFGAAPAFLARTIGMSYKFETFAVKAAVTNYKVAGDFNGYVYSTGFDYFILPELTLETGIYFTSDRNDAKNHSILGGIGLSYFVSKSTMLFTEFAAVNNHGAMNTGISCSGGLFGVQGTTIGGEIGIRHYF